MRRVDEREWDDLARRDAMWAVLSHLPPGSWDEEAFFASGEVQRLPVTAAVWERAARLRAAYRFQPLDATHLATAIEHGCGLFLTADVQLARCTDITVEVLT